MPYVEPVVVRALQAGADELDGRTGGDRALAARVRAAAAQEAAHHREHRAWNQCLAARYGLVRIERWMARTARLLERRTLAQRIAFTAGFEAVAFATARWVDRRLLSQFRDVDAPAGRLFLWHLAEEVEHRGIAEELDVAVAGRTRRAASVAGLVAAVGILGWFTVVAALRMLWHDRRLLHPVALGRLAWWGVSYAFELLPTLTAVWLSGGVGDGRARGLLDPPWLAAWLAGADLTEGTVPALADPLEPLPPRADVPARAQAVPPAERAAIVVASAAATASATVASATGRIDQRS